MPELWSKGVIHMKKYESTPVQQIADLVQEVEDEFKVDKSDELSIHLRMLKAIQILVNQQQQILKALQAK